MRLQTRLLLAIGYVLIVALVAFLVPLAINYRERTDSEVLVQASGQGDLLAVTAAEDLREGAGPASAAGRSPPETARGRVLIVDERGQTSSPTAEARPGGSDFFNRPRSRPRSRAKLSAQRESTSLDTVIRPERFRSSRKTAKCWARFALLRASAAGSSREPVDPAASPLIAGVVLGIGLIAGVVVVREMARPIQAADPPQPSRSLRATSRSVRRSRASSEQRLLSQLVQPDDRAARGRPTRASASSIADASHQLRTPLTGLKG